MNSQISEIQIEYYDAQAEIQNAININMITMKSLQQKEKVSMDALNEYHETLLDAAKILQDNILPIAVTKLLTDDKLIFLKHTNANLLNTATIKNVFVYGLTLKEKENNLLQKLQFDYALYHFCYLISKSILLQIGKKHFDQLKLLRNSKTLHRIALLDNEAESNHTTNKKTWSMETIRSLAAEIQCEDFAVTANEQGCLSPTFSIIGLAIET